MQVLSFPRFEKRDSSSTLRGFHIVYDTALKDLEEMENKLLVGSYFIWRNEIF